MDMPQEQNPEVATGTTSPFDDMAYTPVPTPLVEKQNAFFFGRFGLRAGYGIAIWIVFFAIFTILGGIFAVAATGHMREIMAARMAAQAHPNLPKPSLHLEFVPLLVIVNDGLNFFGFLAVCWFFSRAERRPLRSYGIGSYRVPDFVGGAIWGLMMMSLLIFTLKTLHVLVFDSQALHGAAIMSYGLKWLLAFLFVGLTEEYTFRGYVQFTLMRGVWGLAEKISPANPRAAAFWIAATILSLGFGAAHIHNAGENFFGIVQVVLAGMLFAYALWKTGSLWWAIGFHMTWDWAQSFLYGVADSGNISVGRLFITHPQGKTILSGGADGPEGSVFATVAMLLTFGVIYFLKPGVQPAVEQEPKPVLAEFHSIVA